MPWMTKVPNGPYPRNRTSHFVAGGHIPLCATRVMSDGKTPMLAPFKSTFVERHPDAHLCTSCRVVLRDFMNPAGDEPCTCGVCRVRPRSTHAQHKKDDAR